jgi:uncharacterized protein YdiU (UPF0061 family)
MFYPDHSLFDFDNTFARDLPGFYRRWKPASVPAPRLAFFNRMLAESLDLDADALNSEQGAAIFGGNRIPEGAEPLAQAYAGHQFGGFSPQLGDGRALLLGEILDRQGQRRDLAFKGSGRTSFSRGGDGKAALGPMLREVLIGEAMHALGIPTTRALAVVKTGESVRRDRMLPGAVLTRVASSHLRVGSFEFYAARRETDHLRRLADYAIARHDPDLAQQPAAERYLELLRRVTQRQAALIAQWMNVGFIHGVMNTDNMTLSGETIDYGPCAFMEAYDPRAVFSSIDTTGRYAYGNQPDMAQWNLARLAEALMPLMLVGSSQADIDHAVENATGVIEAFAPLYQTHLLQGQRAKLGLEHSTDPADAALIDDWLRLMHTHGVDFTLSWRRLGDAAGGDDSWLRTLFDDAPALQDWLVRWRERCATEDQAIRMLSSTARTARMAQINPWIIARNHQVEKALEATSERDDLGPFNQLLVALRHPFEVTLQNTMYGQPAPQEITAAYRTFCGT